MANTGSKMRTATWIAGVLCIALIGLSLFTIHKADTNRDMGLAQKLFYYHIGCGIVTALAFTTVFVCSILFLIKREEKYDTAALTAAGIGVVFCMLVLATGSIWARGSTYWNTWWKWGEPRLFTSLIMWFIYLAYLMLRQANPDDRSRAAKFSAVYGLIGYLSVPIVYFSTRLQKESERLHPQNPTLGGHGMHLALRVSMIAFAVLFAFLFLLKLQAALQAARADRLRQRLDDIEDARLLKEMTETTK